MWPIIRAWKGHANTIFIATINGFEIPTEDQADDCIKVLENLLPRLVSVLETAHMGDKVLIDSTTFTACSVEAVAFSQAYVNFCDSGVWG